MNEVFRVSGDESLLEAKCLIEVDDYVPLRFRTDDRPVGASYLRVGNHSQTLVELLIDPNRGIVRGVTITSFASLSSWPRMTTAEVSVGLPILNVPWDGARSIDSGVGFSVAIQDGEILVFWLAVDRCDVLCFQDRVRFLLADGLLAGVRFSGLEPEEVKMFLTHVS